ncbi:MAG: hypothetical protein KF773_26875 [Deltaproteobacteria bacterium]|nr:hypothetical protein [Deltaproteobacteria bacterium]MCW5803495.1 hypothetical protein [Deltaproteobacteria bacterium]
MRAHLALALLVAAAACKGSSSSSASKNTGGSGSAPAVATGKPAGSGSGSAIHDDDDDDDNNSGRPRPIETVREKMNQVDQNTPDYPDPEFKPGDTPKGPPDKIKGDKADSEWTPAEFKSGAARWKDTGVYVDGKPVGFLQWGELPIGIPVVWHRDKVSANKRPGTNDPGWRWANQRAYRFTDYLTAVGVDLKSVKEIHVYGPKMTATLIVGGDELRGERGKQFYFRFGANTYGKAIPMVPGTIGNGNVPDKIASVMVYLNKKAPSLDRDTGMYLEIGGKNVEQTGVPYFGDPIRGGVRIYVDNVLAGIIKRQDLDPKMAKPDKEGALHWKLADVLGKLGVDTKKSVELWVVRADRREEKLPIADVANLEFAASSQAKGGILLGEKSIRANVLAFHSRPLKAEDIPHPTPDDD